MIESLETALWQQPENEQRLIAYQNAFVEQEKLLANDETRHNFIIVIPVADRPQHLEACLLSILQLCERFGYGGQHEGRYRRVEVLIADDSKEQQNIMTHREIATSYEQRGLRCHYFGQSEQLAQLATLDDVTRKKLTPIIGAIPADSFYHKGASIMRNIAYLKLHEMVDGRDDTLIYFIDSDQEFQVRVITANGEQNLYAINYLHQLDRIFRKSDVTILTGKVVGDPPVSPAVMAGNFLDDVSAFLDAMAQLSPETPCTFHDTPLQNSEDAAYHDMAELFGFKQKVHNFDYRCTLDGEHDHAACLADFACKLSRFFDGEHPTRKSYYQHQSLNDTIVPARTIYTGNYCFRAEALRYFIPFATLKLRMAGPVLGRILRAELGERFLSANLPMLHKRTVEEIGQSEFRPGIEREAKSIDLSGEFERQFFGDVMLFTMAQLTDQGYPIKAIPLEQITQAVSGVETKMLHNYTTRHTQIIEKIEQLHQRLTDTSAWWLQEVTSNTRQRFEQFLDNMEYNFGSNAQGYQLINSNDHRNARRDQIIDALANYRDDRALWLSVLERES